MYLGKVVEVGSRDVALQGAQASVHRRAAVGRADPEPASWRRKREPIVLEGDVPSPVNPPSGCRFHPRCPRFVEGHCDVEEPPLYPFGTGHVAACHYPLERWPMTPDEMRRRGTAKRARDGAGSPDVALPMLLTALRRLAVLVVLGSAVVALVSLPLGLLAGASALRALTLGFYLGDAFC